MTSILQKKNKRHRRDVVILSARRPLYVVLASCIILITTTTWTKTNLLPVVVATSSTAYPASFLTTTTTTTTTTKTTTSHQKKNGVKLPLQRTFVIPAAIALGVKARSQYLPKLKRTRQVTALRASVDDDDDVHVEKDSPAGQEQEGVHHHSITVSYEGASCRIDDIRSAETILTALERNQRRLQRELGLPDLPSDCRRGNCLTCAARIVANVDVNNNSNSDRDDSSIPNNNDKRTSRLSPTSSATSEKMTITSVEEDNGLSPALSKQVRKEGYILTCSSQVTSSGLNIQLGEQDSLWKFVYRHRLEAEETQYVAREAMARLLRKTAERNIQQWTKETEEILRKTHSSE